MKKSLLLFLAAMLLPVALHAQQLNVPEVNQVLQRTSVLKSLDNRMKAPAKIDLPANQKIMGHYDTDDIQTGGYLGLTGFPGVIPVATVLEPDELTMFQGGKIVKFRVGLAQSTPVTRVFVAPVSSTGSIGDITEWTCNVSNEGWNIVALETPYDINLGEGEGLLIGFDYKQTSSNYPISTVEVGTIYPSYCYLTYQGQTDWFDVGLDSYGNLSLQCIVENESYPDYMISSASLNCSNYIKAGEALSYAFKMRNLGTQQIEAGAVAYNVLVDGNIVETLTNEVALTGDFADIEGTVATDGLESGAHSLSIQILGMDGIEATISPETLETTFKVYENSFPRQKHLIEELTSNSCTYCPLGASMLSKLMALRDDIAMVAVHGNQSSVDPCNTAQADSIFSYLGAEGWPYAAFNRATGWEDDEHIACGIGYYEQYHQQIAEELSSFLDYLAEVTPSFATIEINGSYADADSTKAIIEVSGELTPDFATMMGEDAKLTVYLTEDSLVYRQLNQGSWVPRYVHNHVFRLALGSVFGVDLNKTSDTRYANTFEVELDPEWNLNKMDVVAIISRPLQNAETGVFTDMYVNNANSLSLNEATAGIEELLVDNNAVPVGYYDITGRQHSELQQGVNIVKMSDGTAKKVLVK